MTAVRALPAVPWSGMQMLTVSAPWGQAVSDWDADLRAAHRPVTTRGLRIYHLRRLGHDHPHRTPWDLGRADLVQWLGGRAWAAETRRSYRASIRLFYRWAHATGRTPVDPAHTLPAIRVPRGLPRPAPDDVVRAAVTIADERTGLMLQVLLQTGMRRGELARLHVDDVERDLLGWSLRVHGKGGHTRAVPITDTLATAIRTYPAGWVFPGQIDGHLSPRRVGELVSEVLGPGWTAHTLRHRFATMAYAVDRDLRATQELLGHARPETTAIYTKVPDEAKRRAALSVAGSLAA